MKKLDYFTWSQEYYRDAQNLKETIKKYEEQLKSADYTNLEFLNSTISTYRNIYYDLINIAKELESRSKEKINAAQTDFHNRKKSASDYIF